MFNLQHAEKSVVGQLMERFLAREPYERRPNFFDFLQLLESARYDNAEYCDVMKFE